jgi:hypothetical protein
VQSPWNSDNAILIASGNTDEGTIKSAQALSAGALRPGTPANNVAIVDKVMSAPARYTYEVDQTFADLGYRTAEMNDIGVNYESYEFYIPHGQTVTEEAYLDLLFGYSALIQYDNSGIVIRLNGKPIGSIALTAQSAQQSINRVRVQIPKEAVISGVNEIELRVNLDPVDRCTNPDLEGIYANIWPESLLHLPLTQVTVPAELNFNLNLFPAPFQYTPSLETTAFVLQNDDFNTWREVFKVAAYLGDVTNGNISTFKTYFGDNVPEEERGNYNFIVVGRPSQMPFMAELNEYLPAPFETGSDLASEPQMQVEFRINPSTPVGYVELFPSPWNDENVIVAALGNTEKGIFWAVSHLVEPLSWDMAGNFTAISDKQVFTADTRLSILTPNIISEGDQELVVEALPPSIVEDDFAPPPAYRPAWLLPAIEGSIVLIGIIIVAVLITSRSRKRSHK